MFSIPLLMALTAFGKKCENILGYELEFKRLSEPQTSTCR